MRIDVQEWFYDSSVIKSVEKMSSVAVRMPKKTWFYLFWHQLWSLFSIKMLAKNMASERERASEAPLKFWTSRASASSLLQNFRRASEGECSPRSPQLARSLNSVFLEHWEKPLYLDIESLTRLRNRELSNFWSKVLILLLIISWIWNCWRLTDEAFDTWIFPCGLSSILKICYFWYFRLR